jgi:hypothetical protein
MAKKLLSIQVKGNQSEWAFSFYGDPKYLPEWRADGLDIVELENVIPAWVVDIGLLRQWVFMQDLFNFKNPFFSKAGKTQAIKDFDKDAE